MTRPRYIALVRETPDAAPDASLAFDRLVRGRSDIVRVLETPFVSLAATRRGVVSMDRRGALVGTVFHRDTGNLVTALDEDRRRRILASGGRELVRGYWGNYVAFLASGDRCDVLRAPLGTLPCLHVALRGAVVVSSDMDLLVASGLYSPAVDWDQVVQSLAFRDLRARQTCLEGVGDLRGGQRLAAGPEGAVRQDLWSPWQFVSGGAAADDIEAMAEDLGAVVRGCVAAQSAPFERPLVMLSGGLDSSIVAACLAGGHRASALNLVTAEASGDERAYARAVAGALKMPLAERGRDVARIDPACSPARRLPRPSVRMFLQESMRLARDVAVETGARAIVNGGGGDNVFCSLQSSAPVADRLRVEGPGRGAIETARAVSLLAPARMSEVLADAVRRAWLGKPAFRLRSDRSLLGAGVSDRIVSDRPHSWLEVPRGALPGRAMHVYLIAAAQGYVECLDPLDPLPTLVPLLSQPVVERCLAIPTWRWFEAGRNRAVARRAFARALPREVIERRSKGTPDAFVAQIFETHRPALREILAEGQLARRGLVDRDALLAAIDDPRPAYGDRFRRVLEFADVEVWAGGWTGSA